MVQKFHWKILLPEGFVRFLYHGNDRYGISVLLQNNLIIFGRIEQGRNQVVIRKRIKKGFKTIVLDEDVLRIHYKNFISNKKSRFNVIDYKLP